MFTGLIEATGTVISKQLLPAGGALLVIQAPFTEPVGASVALNGVCLTVQRHRDLHMEFEMVPETLRRTNLGDLQQGDCVNLERPLMPHSRLGGHFVQGHVDTTAEIVAIRPEGNGRVFRFRLHERDYMRYIVPKGSIAIDGISLTVVDVETESFTVWVIPHTWEVTNLRKRQVGERVNVETDILARYVERLMVYHSR